MRQSGTLLIGSGVALAATVLLGIVLLGLIKGDALIHFLQEPVCWGMVLMSEGMALRGWEMRADSQRPNRYVGGRLTVCADKPRLLIMLLSLQLVAAGLVLFGFSGFKSFSELGLGGFFVAFGAVSAAMCIAVLALFVHRLIEGGPALEISEHGLFAPALMRRPVRWDEIESLPVFAICDHGVLAINAHDPRENRKWSLLNQFGAGGSYRIGRRSHDATLADMLLAISQFQPHLTERLIRNADLGRTGRRGTGWPAGYIRTDP